VPTATGFSLLDPDDPDDLHELARSAALPAPRGVRAAAIDPAGRRLVAVRQTPPDRATQLCETELYEYPLE
jgi:hypothetical protein